MNLWVNIVQELQGEKDEMKEVLKLLVRKDRLLAWARPSQLLRPTPGRTFKLVPVERSKGNFGGWQSAAMHFTS